MKCDSCGKTLFKNERTCPYCGRVFGPSKGAIVAYAVAALLIAAIAWFFLRG